MEIKLTDRAAAWFEEKIPLHEGEAIRFFGKTYGKTEIHEGFSVGMQVDDPKHHQDILALTEVNGRQYFTTREDEWFFNDYVLEIDLKDELNEPEYHFIKDTNNN